MLVVSQLFVEHGGRELQCMCVCGGGGVVPIKILQRESRN